MKFSDFIRVRKYSFNQYIDRNEIDENFTICKRENNSKRDFIIVQELLGKHVPKHPTSILNYFKLLKNEVIRECKYFDKDNSNIVPSEKNGIFYFAETATMIGEYLADSLNIKHKLCTTREKKEDKDVLLFEITESHCHAPEHYIYGNAMELKNLDRILIVDDEITSGNTIKQVIEELRKIINPNLKIYVASFINLMSPETIIEFTNKYQTIISSLIFGEIRDINKKVELDETVGAPYYTNEFENSYLVLGTEENMYNAYIQALNLENLGFDVYFHATTRSPILPSNENNYSLKMRKQVPSCKDSNRINYVYNLQKYKQIFIFRDITENKKFDEKMKETLNDYSIEPVKFYNYSNKEEN